MLRERLRPSTVVRVAAGAVLGLLLAVACDDSDSPTAPLEEGLFLVRACRGSQHAPGGELFRVLIRDPATVAEAESLVGAGTVKIVAGPVVAGDGGFNAPWSWHLDPDGVAFADLAAEVCDGCPSFVEEDLDNWIATVGNYCPWSTEILARER